MKTKKILTILTVMGLVASTGFAATEADISYLGASETVNGAIFEQLTLPEDAGTGDIQPFLNLQNSPTEEGFNTDGTKMPDAESPWTRSLLLDDIKKVQRGSTWYREFLLDVNETTPGSLISLDTLMIYQEGSPTIGSLAGLTNLVYNMDGVGDYYIKIDQSISGSGSGRYDMLLLVPDALFDDTILDPPQYVYFYSVFGNAFSTDDGFEEWDVDDPGNPPIPEPATIALLALGGIVLRSSRHKVKK